MEGLQIVLEFIDTASVVAPVLRLEDPIPTLRGALVPPHLEKLGPARLLEFCNIGERRSLFFSSLEIPWPLL